MDIITEILETDKMAQQKLDEAEARRVEILKNAETEIEGLKADAKTKIDDYRQQKDAEVKKKTEADVLKIRTAEQVKIHEFDKLYEDSHEDWEKEILEGILAQ